METTPKRRSNAAGHAGRRLASFFGEKIEGRPREKMGGWPGPLAVPVRCPAQGCSFYRNSIMNSLPGDAEATVPARFLAARSDASPLATRRLLWCHYRSVPPLHAFAFALRLLAHSIVSRLDVSFLKRRGPLERNPD
ncbi:hypothetical protein MTO96_001503 [Rhipicephalus appendiculatus]